MKYRFLADADTMTREVASGLAAIYPESVCTLSDSFNGRALLKQPISSDRVNIIVSSGGSGGPFTSSYTFGPDLADASVNGNICAAPSAYDIYEVAKAINSPHGYVLLYNNFMGDILNNDLALELMMRDGYKGTQVRMTDDVLSVDSSAPVSERTGLNGIAYAAKVGGGLARTGASLEEVTAMIEYVNSRVRSTLMTFDFEKKLIQIGEGISGEPARLVYENKFNLKDAAALAYDMLYQDLKPASHERMYICITRTYPTAYEDGVILAKNMREYAKDLIYQMSEGYFFRMSDSYGCCVTMLSVDERAWPFLEKRAYTDSFVL